LFLTQVRQYVEKTLVLNALNDSNELTIGRVYLSLQLVLCEALKTLFHVLSVTAVTRIFSHFRSVFQLVLL
jgi:hypothetical protein